MLDHVRQFNCSNKNVNMNEIMFLCNLSHFSDNSELKNKRKRQKRDHMSTSGWNLEFENLLKKSCWKHIEVV